MEHFFDSIEGWFDFGDIYIEMINRAAADAPSYFVEVGSWKGKSAAFMCVEIANSGKQIKFDCIDIWNGAGADDEYASHDATTLFDDFINNMKPVEGLYTPVREWSAKAAERYIDGSLNFVFLDAGHEYEDILADIQAWLPKVKPGGFIGGHDFHAHGVRRAVNESFPGYYQHNSSWIVPLT
jgi:cephalosporin hydroxylase